MSRTVIRVLASGPQALIEDLGRPGYAHLGVPRSGAADRAALRLANRLVGNDEGSAGVEVLLGGLELLWQGTRPTWMALAGASSDLLVGDTDEPSHTTVLVRPGDRVLVGRPEQGLRGYLAVRGGIVVPPVLGSRSTDLLSGLGPAPLREGDKLPVGAATGSLPGTDFAVVRAGPAALTITAGPRADWFTAEAERLLTASTWTVSPDSNRTAVRLSGPRLERRIDAELPSEGITRGAIQVPSSGQPLIFLADHPVTGGYPVIGVATPDAVERAAQLRPGVRVRFRRTGRDLLRTQEPPIGSTYNSPPSRGC